MPVTVFRRALQPGPEVSQRASHPADTPELAQDNEFTVLSHLLRLVARIGCKIEPGATFN